MYYVNPEKHLLTLNGVKLRPGIHPIQEKLVEQAKACPLRGKMIGTDCRVSVFESLREAEEAYDPDTLVQLVMLTFQPATPDEVMTYQYRIDRLKEFWQHFEGGHIREYLLRTRAVFSGDLPKQGSRFQSTGEKLNIVLP